MKKILFALIVAATVAVGLYAQRDPFFPPTAITLGQGGSFTANAEGFNAFFYNPAGFNRKKEFTLASVNVYGTMDKTIFNILWKQLTGGSASSGGTSKGLQSRGDSDSGFNIDDLGLPPETAAALGEVADGFANLGAYVGDAEAATPGSSQAALDQVLSNLANNPDLDPAVVAAIQEAQANASGGGDLSSLLADLAPVLLADPDLLDTIISDYVDTLETTSSVTYDPNTYGEIPQINEALKKAFPSGNLNAGVLLGIGWVGGGLGVGVFANAEAGIYTPEGSSLLGAQGRVLNTITVAGGLAFPLFDGFDIGFSVRPTILGYADMNVSEFLTKMLDPNGGGLGDLNELLANILSNGIYKGFRLGVDVGVLWDIGPFTLGAAIKDLIPFPVTYTRYDSYQDYLAALVKAGGISVSAEDAKALYNPMIPKVNIGLQFHPDLGAFKAILDPRVGVDVYDILGAFSLLQDAGTNSFDKYNFLKTINLGAEIKLLNTIALRGGLNRGALTGGVGVHLLFIDINLAASTVLAPTAADTQTLDFTQVGFAAEFAIRF